MIGLVLTTATALGAPRAKVSLQDSGADGPGYLPEGSVQEKVRVTRIADIRRCYQAALETDPKLVGDVFVRFALERSARPSAIAVDAPTSALEACVRTYVKRWSFATPRGDDGKPST